MGDPVFLSIVSFTDIFKLRPGRTALVFLYIVRGFCNYGARRWPRLSRTSIFIFVLRNAFVIIVLTIASKLWLNPLNVGKKPKYPISILKDVPRGFQHMRQPKLNTGLLSAIAPELPVSVISCWLGHWYRRHHRHLRSHRNVCRRTHARLISPQLPADSFILHLFSFYWIPNAALSAVIIHAVGDLIASPKAAYQFWLVQPLELFQAGTYTRRSYGPGS
ncbi:hypothetical protein CF319_g4474 [Tilletia indica]|nr:hypothetical protein CF319_g4474 [Tilletia indica]